MVWKSVILGRMYKAQGRFGVAFIFHLAFRRSTLAVTVIKSLLVTLLLWHGRIYSEWNIYVTLHFPW